MSDREDPNAIFDGEGSLSSGQFLRLIRQNAIEKDKTTDDQWTAYYASSRMDGLALEWFEEQTEEVQESWKLLRRALMTRWPPAARRGADGTATAAASPQEVHVPTPAAAAPPPPSLATWSARPVSSTEPITGRILVVVTGGDPLGYLSKYFGSGEACLTTKATEDAQLVKLSQLIKPDKAYVCDDSLKTTDAFLGWKVSANASRFIEGVLAHLHEPTAAPKASTSTSTLIGASHTIKWYTLLNRQIVPFNDMSEGMLQSLDIAIETEIHSLVITPNITELQKGFPTWKSQRVHFILEPV